MLAFQVGVSLSPKWSFKWPEFLQPTLPSCLYLLSHLLGLLGVCCAFDIIADCKSWIMSDIVHQIMHTVVICHKLCAIIHSASYVLWQISLHFFCIMYTICFYGIICISWLIPWRHWSVSCSGRLYNVVMQNSHYNVVFQQQQQRHRHNDHHHYHHQHSYYHGILCQRSDGNWCE